MMSASSPRRKLWPGGMPKPLTPCVKGAGMLRRSTAVWPCDTGWRPGLPHGTIVGGRGGRAWVSPAGPAPARPIEEPLPRFARGARNLFFGPGRPTPGSASRLQTGSGPRPFEPTWAPGSPPLRAGTGAAPDRVDIGEVDPSMDEDGLDGLFGGLLGVKAEVFQIRAWKHVLSPDQVAPGAVEPLAGVIGREALRPHRRPYLPPTPRRSRGSVNDDSVRPRQGSRR